MVEITQHFKTTVFTATDAAGKSYKWAFWHDTRTPARWMLRDHEGYVRPLETTWIDSVPRIKMILENYGFTAEIS